MKGAPDVAQEAERVELGLKAFAHYVSNRDEIRAGFWLGPIKQVASSVLFRAIEEVGAISVNLRQTLRHQLVGEVLPDTSVQLCLEERGPLQKPFDARKQRVNVKRLGNVVVHARSSTLESTMFVGFRRQEDERDCPGFPAVL